MDETLKHPDYERHMEEWKRTLPDATPEQIHEKVVAHLAFKEQVKEKAKVIASKPQVTIPCQFIPSKCEFVPPVPPKRSWELRVIVYILAAILLALIVGIVTKAEPAPAPVPPATYERIFARIEMLPQVGNVPIPLPVSAGSGAPLYVICSSGCSAAGSFADNSAFTVGMTPGSILFGYYTSGSAPTLSTGNAARARIDANSYLIVDCATGCSSGALTTNNAAPIGNNSGVLPCLANAAAPSLTETYQVLCSVDLAGRQRVTGAGGTFPVTGTFYQATQPVSGTFWQTTQPVSGTFYQTTQPVSLATAPTTPVTGTFYQATQPVSIASAQIASGAVASGAYASGSIASGAVASGAVASGAIASGACAVGCIADGGIVTLGAEANAKSTATDTTPITQMSVFKEISYMVQNPAALPANQSVNVAQINGAAPVLDPCQGQTKLFINISQTGNTQIITGTSAKKIYICGISIPPQVAGVSLSLTEGTGSTCGTSTIAVSGLFGGDGTAAKGATVAINGGLMYGNGGYAVGVTSVTADNVCLFNSGSAQVSGGVVNVVQ